MSRLSIGDGNRGLQGCGQDTRAPLDNRNRPTVGMEDVGWDVSLVILWHRAHAGPEAKDFIRYGVPLEPIIPNSVGRAARNQPPCQHS
jgi:hypothetical protein